MTIAKSIPADAIDAGVEMLDTDGYVVLENAISEDAAADLAKLVLSSPQRIDGVKGYEFCPGLLNHDPAFLDLCTHPGVMQLTRHLIGGRTGSGSHYFTWPEADQVRIGAVDGLVAHPGSENGWWHQDSPAGQLNPDRPLPDFPFMVNVFWILTPFTERTGATRFVPGSHRVRELPPPTQDDLDEQVFCEAPPGSVAIVPNTLWHAAGNNRSDAPRVGIACNYVPWWLGRLTMDNVPVRRDVWEQLPPEAQAMTKHQLMWHTDFLGELRDDES
jgi:ectoine hydroxylase-related dioxygenase (phytanoyl-CoA dioxygenase family)